MASLNKLLNKIGFSWHDIFIVILIFETFWWGMFVFMDSCDVVIRAIHESSKTEYHVFVLVQRCISLLKVASVLICLWYGVIFLGSGLFIRLYLIFGVFIDTMFTLSWIIISTEESWPLSPTNLYGLHYIITFVLLRVTLYGVLHFFIMETFVSPFGFPVVGTLNGAVVGIPDQGNNRTLNSGINLAFLGKGVKAVLQYYRVEMEHAFLVAVLWDVFWNWTIIFSQELPEFTFNYVFVGLFGSLALNVTTDDLFLRIARLMLGLVAIYLVTKKSELYMKIWIAAYIIVTLIGIGFFCYLTTTSLVDETVTEIIVLCTAFFASYAAKLFVVYCSLRYYLYLKKGNARLVSENNNES